MAGIGIVNNPRSRRNLRRPGTAARLRTILGGDGEVVDASTPDELDRAVERFRGAGIELLGIHGGDGTAHYVLSAFARAFGAEPLPAVALLPGGGMNTVARGSGVRGSPEAVLERIVARRRAGLPQPAVERDLLAVEADDGPALHGFLFGTGCAVAFLEAYYASPDPSPARAAILAARAVLSALVGGRFARALARREPIEVLADGERWPKGDYLTVLAGSSPELGLGFRPFARCDEQPGFFHAVGVTGSAYRLALSAPRIRLGWPWKRRVAMDAVVRELRLEPRAPIRFNLDGDLYRAERSLRLWTGPALRLLADRGAARPR
ncbi:MAG TPA: diacylglycerol kinase family protein [Anaeromyxobacteraceae bacterium]|nr:diacylglycerol kinase family protein [Anaeromyxobacteraceae bacterium]